MLSSHSTLNKHKFVFNSPEILQSEPNLKKRECIESIHIAINLDKVVNERKDANNIHMYYSNIINQLKYFF